MEQKLYNYLKKNRPAIRKEIVNLTFDLVECNTINPPGLEISTARVVKDYFRKHGINFKVYKKLKNRPNVIGYVGKGKPTVLVAGHMDTVPVGDIKLWHTDPFKAVAKKDRLYGRGTMDNKGPLASCMVTARILNRFSHKLKGQFLIAAVADEETGSKYGMEFLVQDGCVKPDFAIIPDIGGNIQEIAIAEKGVLNVMVTAFGKAAHSSKPQLGVNAINNMSEYLLKLKKYKLKYTKHKYLSPPTINASIIHGGTASNIVPDKCETIINIRYLISQTPDKILRELKSIVPKGKKFRFEILDILVPTEVPEKNLIIKTIKKTTENYLGKKVKLIGMSGATVAKSLINRGIIAVGFGPGDDRVAHMANEYISIKQLVDFSGLLSLIITEMLK